MNKRVGTSKSLVKVGEGNPQAREEEGKLSLVSTEHSSYPAGIPRMWGSEFHGNTTTFTSPYQPKHCPECSALCLWLLSIYLLGTAQLDGWREGPLLD